MKSKTLHYKTTGNAFEDVRCLVVVLTSLPFAKISHPLAEETKLVSDFILFNTFQLREK
jgi:hypothetical protein